MYKVHLYAFLSFSLSLSFSLPPPPPPPPPPPLSSRHGDHYEWEKVTSCIHNVLGGQRWVDQYGQMTITNGGKCSCKLTFVKVRDLQLYYCSTISIYTRACRESDELMHLIYSYIHVVLWSPAYHLPTHQLSALEQSLFLLTWCPIQPGYFKDFTIAMDKTYTLNLSNVLATAL